MPLAMRRDFEAQNKELIDAIMLMRGGQRSGRRTSAGSADEALHARLVAANSQSFGFKCDIL